MLVTSVFRLVCVTAVLFACCLWSTSCSLDANSELCFIGDSITHLWDLEYYFPGYHIHKHAVDGAKIESTDNWDVSDCHGLPIVILMGTNNIGNNSVMDDDADSKRQKFNEDFFKRVVLFEGNPLWVISILPRNKGYTEQKDINQNIELQNKLLKNSIEALGNAYGFIDVYNLFLDRDYRIDSTLFNDGLHPSELGYEILASNVQARL